MTNTHIATTAAPADERRFDRGAWLTLGAVALFTICALLVFAFSAVQPTDGCLIQQGTSDTQTLLGCVGDWPTPLRSGDEIIAVTGRSMRLDVEAIFPPPPPAGWVAGASVPYTLRREGAVITLAVPLQRLSWGGVGRLLVADPVNLLVNTLVLLVAGTAFALRPNGRATQLLLLSQGLSAIGQLLSVSMLLISQVAWSFWPTPALTGFAALFSLFGGWLSAPMLLLLLLSFPRRVWPLTRWPRLTTALIFGVGAAASLLVVLTANFVPFLVSLGLYAVLTLVVFVAAAIGTAVRGRDPVVRAQTIWLSLGFAVNSLQVFLWLVALAYAPFGVWLQTNAALNAAQSLVTRSALPVCLGIAITRYRLFDIEIIIRRTLVYTLLTLTLGATYFASVVGLQALFVGLTGQESTLAVVVSTLAIAALFGPLRRWVQAIIDRRFFRRKYDARRVLEAFAVRAQNEADLDVLSADLLSVVQETLEPEGVKLWLVRPQSYRQQPDT
jgi:hypothetical protein